MCSGITVYLWDPFTYVYIGTRTVSIAQLDHVQNSTCEPPPEDEPGAFKWSKKGWVLV